MPDPSVLQAIPFLSSCLHLHEYVEPMLQLMVAEDWLAEDGGSGGVYVFTIAQSCKATLTPSSKEARGCSLQSMSPRLTRPTLDPPRGFLWRAIGANE